MSLHLDKTTWKRVSLGDVAANVNVSVNDPEVVGIERIVAMEHLDPGELKITRWGSIDDNATFTRRVEPRQTLFGKRRAYQRKAAYAEFSAITSGDILVFQADEDKLLPEFLPFLVQSDGFYHHAVGTSAGSLSPRTNWRDLAKYEFDLPPLDEQKRLAALLWSVESHRSAVTAERAAISAARSAWLSEAVTRLLGQATVPFAKMWARAPESGWSAPPVDEHTGHYVLSLAALGPDGYRPGQFKNVLDSTELRSARLVHGDLLISRANTIDAVGRVGIFDEERDDVSFPDTMMRVHLVEDVRPEFVAAVLSSSHGRAHMRRTAAGSATSMVKINRRSLATMLFPLASMDQQEHLLEKVSSFDTALGSTEKTVAEIGALKSGLLTKIFEDAA
ncbi:restriction endonuclease subunit S [Saccharothrix sp. S26]|uniref:restriction endonuclease subunit S n=1 Tax=Saccharothrix sp. S26 TaxID=2907215 RepID=UPI001F2ABAA9|nr:restriction endonuclease subunit S [Saccharothrix sp. S26]MCE6993303.1 restriction endonuclease subunit S [Saccharothrix sp. S26]